MGEVGKSVQAGPRHLRWRVLLRRVTNLVRSEGRRQGLGPAGRDEAYGRVLRDLLRRTASDSSSNQADVSHLSRLVRWRTSEVARRQKWNAARSTDPAVLDRLPAPESEADIDPVLQAALHRALLHLRPEEARILVMTYWCAFGAREIARTGCFPHHEDVRRRFRHALSNMHVALESDETIPIAAPDPGIARVIEWAACSLRCPREHCAWS